jgi:hypothetical protein
LCSARIQRLEDLLSVLVSGEVYDDDLQGLAYSCLDRGGPRLDRALAVIGEPLARLLAEVSVGINHPLAAVIDCLVVDGRFRGHDRIESGPVAIRWPHLEAVLRPGAEGLCVRYERFDPRRWLESAHAD